MCLKNVNFEMRCVMLRNVVVKNILISSLIVILFEERIVDTRNFQMCFWKMWILDWNVA